MEKLFFSIEDTELMLSETVKYYEKTNKTIDHIVVASRGGLYLGLRLSHLFNIPLSIIDYSLRDFKSEKNEPILAIDKISSSEKKDNILFFDEILDTGETAIDIIKMLSKKFPDSHIDADFCIAKEDALSKLLNELSDIKGEIAAFSRTDKNDIWVDFFWEVKEPLNPNINEEYIHLNDNFKGEKESNSYDTIIVHKQ